MSAPEPVSFPGAGGAMLAARLHRPAGPAAAWAIFAHCFACSKESVAAVRIAAALAAQGIAVLRFDFTGLGDAGGEPSLAGFSSNVGDIAAAADWMRRAHGAPRLLVGHSLGGSAAIVAAARIPETVAVATIGAPFDPAHVRRMLAPALPGIEARGEARVRLGDREFRIGREFLDDLEAHDMAATLSHLGRALLVLHSPVDTVVDIANAARIFGAAKHPRSFVSLDHADHLLARSADAAYVGTVLAAWASRYLDASATAGTDLRAEPGTVLVAEAGDGRYAQNIRVGPHALRADEPLAAGGEDTGPSPYGLLLAGLGACTSMTLRMYADRKGWPLDRVRVELRHDKIHAADCETCETKEGRVDRIERVIELAGPLDGEQRRRLLEIADRCPVHRTLEGEILIPTRLKE